MRSFIAVVLLGLAGLCPVASRAQVIAPTAPATPQPERRPGLGPIRSWGYQLQHADIDRVVRSPYDLVVVDYSRNGQDSGRFSRAEVERMRQRPDGGRRIVLAYLSIGEAEDYRYYWRDEWVEGLSVIDDPAGLVRPGRATPPALAAGPVKLKALRLPRLGAPAWLGRENEAWPGNFFVRYWDERWQGIVFRSPQSYLARIIEAGFDGVYLDRIDTFQQVEADGLDARGQMVRFVVELAARARALKPGFRIVPQNGEQLLSDAAYLAAIDAIAKEDLLLGEEGEGTRNPPATVARSMRWLAPAQNRGIPVLVVEYVAEPPLVEALRADIAKRGFVAYFGVRALDRLVLPEELTAAAVPPGANLPAASKLGRPVSAGGARRAAPAAK